MSNVTPGSSRGISGNPINMSQQSAKGQGGPNTSIYQQTNNRQSFKINQELKLKNNIKSVIEGKFVTILMSLVTIFALVGDDIRLWTTSKDADIYFVIGLSVSFVLFTLEVLLTSVVVDDFKYSFFFYLDIVATLSIVSDINWMLDMLVTLVGERSYVESVNAIPGVLETESMANGKINQVFKSLRLIRLIRIIKLYKYIIQSKQRKEDAVETQRNQKQSTKKILDTSQVSPGKGGLNNQILGGEEEEVESLFKRETDPSKLGKALTDQNTREIIIGVLLMLMVLPLLSHSEIDYAQEYGLRQIFWVGRSDCKVPEVKMLPSSMIDLTIEATDHIYCDPEEESWVSEEGWYELLRQYSDASKTREDSPSTWELLWMYVPDHMSHGQMKEIKMLPKKGQPYNETEIDPYWKQTDLCAGFEISPDCPWRQEEMALVTFTPIDCLNGDLEGCEYLVAYARILQRANIQEQAQLQFITTIFTCIVLTCAFMVFSHDTEVIVIIPIKKVVEIIQTLAENPLKKPVQPVPIQETSHQMKTQMLELTIFKIGTLLQRGFGELGAGIVADGLIQMDPGIDLNATGKRVELVFSICRIRQFTETTECLQDEIIVFVNKIVKIIHECTKKWDGKPSKNYGDKYLLTWRMPIYTEAIDYIKGDEQGQSKVMRKNGTNILSPGKGDQTERKALLGGNGKNGSDSKSAPIQESEDQLFSQMTQAEMETYREEVADRCMIAAIKTIAEISRAQDLQAYSRHPKIHHKFSEKYNIKISFALHTGKAVQGPIGSEFKVDAVYLSTEMQVALRIDQLTDVYDRQILISGDLHRLISPAGKQFCRKIDTITMNETPNSSKEIYCVDIFNIEQVVVEQEDFEPQLGEFIPHHMHEGPVPQTKGVEYVFIADHDLFSLQRQQKFEFLDAFAKARESYAEGDWINAQTGLNMALAQMPHDGPSRWMMQYLEKNKVLPPEDWKGIRDIDKKVEAPSIDFMNKDDEEWNDDEEEQDISQDIGNASHKAH